MEFVALTILIGLSVGAIAWHAFVASKLVIWYLVPVWPAASVLDAHVLAGLICLLYLFRRNKSQKEHTAEQILDLFLAEFFGPALILLFGYLLR